ncbi:hypothetical protein MHU86_18013 [Fragilaria crotonensis]|nr:hypothetical protein MHU86_18013 [Fragilaria crotonensis]
MVAAAAVSVVVGVTMAAECAPVKPGVAGSEATNAFLVAELELVLNSATVHSSTGRSRNFRWSWREGRSFNHSQSEGNDRDIRDGDASESGNSLNIGDFGPKILDRIVEVPRRIRLNGCVRVPRVSWCRIPPGGG